MSSIGKNSHIRISTVGIKQTGEYPMKRLSLLAAASIALFSALPAHAKIFSDAAKLGANAGAMQYCKKIDSANEGKYNLLGIRTLKEYERLDTGDRAKALIYRNKAEQKGIYLSDPLNKERCRKIRRTLHLTS
ncbi:hypothetical protein MD588_08830 [Photobacterium sp. SDRW27]|uniref:hypothetical protein n=1 Tax=Photobacterium obscurum TaxID=2829490 RepID=UPI0022434E81|nr:hypothetical protein [Photobacterium obscurum]MCW8328912.1 hypothetical protein [Photobacterium obscurum]